MHDAAWLLLCSTVRGNTEDNRNFHDHCIMICQAVFEQDTDIFVSAVWNCVPCVDFASC